MPDQGVFMVNLNSAPEPVDKDGTSCANNLKAAIAGARKDEAAAMTVIG